ncbi:hypothetical protein WAI453_001525 [Rhynchosporium graminicola]|uniref:Uncharacterized protein n=1 Tax=Rhynchosporium graminicola TaxID=2792576 RepID=A0A1E1KCF7_9HELO|nr:uncharacterized protein RCO7_10936 [Rhynchosporium commune]
MRLSYAALVIFASTVMARATPHTSRVDAVTDPFHCKSFGSDCSIKLIPNTETYQCNCTTNPNSLPDLARFYSDNNYKGFEYQGYGNYKSCQNLPFPLWDQETGSMTSNTNPAVICCVFTGLDCVKEGRHWTPVDPKVQEFQGYYHSGVRSFMCNLKVDEKSTCDGL